MIDLIGPLRPADDSISANALQIENKCFEIAISATDSPGRQDLSTGRKTIGPVHFKSCRVPEKSEKPSR
jgi:hypothetical protein